MSQPPRSHELTVGGCPKCHSALRIGSSLVGKRLQCRRCQSAIEVAEVDGILRVMLVKPTSDNPPAATSPLRRPPGNSAVVTLLMLALPMLSGCSGCEKKPTKSPPPSEATEQTDKNEPAESKPEESREEPSEDETQVADRPSSDGDTTSVPEQQAPTSTPPGEKQPKGEVKSAAGGQKSDNKLPPSTKQSSASKRAKGPRADPVAALRKGREAYERSQRKSAANDHQGAFRDAADAWELLNQCESDAACRELASRIFDQLDGLAEKANQKAKAGSGVSGKTLIEK